MNNDGWGQVGAGQDDYRIAGKDLQHNRQTRTADELHVPVRKVRQEAQGGGPMKEHMEHKHHSHHESDLHHHLEAEKHQHHHAQEHAHHHMERHHKRHHDSQHGHDTHQHHYGR